MYIFVSVCHSRPWEHSTAINPIIVGPPLYFFLRSSKHGDLFAKALAFPRYILRTLCYCNEKKCRQQYSEYSTDQQVVDKLSYLAHDSSFYHLVHKLFQFMEISNFKNVAHVVLRGALVEVSGIQIPETSTSIPLDRAQSPILDKKRPTRIGLRK